MPPPETPARTKPQSAWKLAGLSVRQLAGNVFRDVTAHNFFGRASELAFDFLFALFPLLLFMLTLIGLFTSGSAELQGDLLAFFSDFLPRTAFALLNTTAMELASHASNGKLTAGILFALWFASGGVSSMISALNLAYGAKEERSWLRVRAIALCLTLLISALLLAALLLVLVSGHAADWLGIKLGLTPEVVALWKALQWPAAIAFVILSHALIYYFGPHLENRRWRWVTPGSVFGVVLWLAASLGLRIYLHFFNSYSTTYGSLGAVMILLVWLYVTGFAFLVGGEINAEIERAAARAV
ncbi:MAG TPA: YihY/virulence factor BrkB family protein [Candidatus Acidoferrales bacterium]|jgi:membrane protein|nr:YihY/virulence factor BrkB family protein [Candidatus Acidoferrales bacterium]